MKIKLLKRLEVLMKDSGISTFAEMAARTRDKQALDIGHTSVGATFYYYHPSPLKAGNEVNPMSSKKTRTNDEN